MGLPCPARRSPPPQMALARKTSAPRAGAATPYPRRRAGQGAPSDGRLLPESSPPGSLAGLSASIRKAARHPNSFFQTSDSHRDLTQGRTLGGDGSWKTTQPCAISRGQLGPGHTAAGSIQVSKFPNLSPSGGTMLWALHAKLSKD